MAIPKKMEPTFKDTAEAVQIAIATTTDNRNQMAVINGTNTALVMEQQTKVTLPTGTVIMTMMG